MDTNEPDTGSVSYEDQRESRRASLMLRSAKVVCQTGEYASIIRDVSSLGVGLSFLHTPPPEPRILLELGSGDTYPIERVWLGKNRAGYRFASPIDLDEFIHEESPFETRAIRLRIAADAQVLDGKHKRSVRLRDLSCEGASFECEDTIDQCGLIGFYVGGISQRLGKVCWHNDIVYGMSFQHPLSVEELAAAALRLQPYEEYTTTRRKSGFGAIRAA